MESKQIRLLVVEDTPDDFELMLLQLKQSGLQVLASRVETAIDFQKALFDEEWDIIISDFDLPSFSASAALEIVRETRPEIPFVVVSGMMAEEQAVELMRNGAADYMMKDRLGRLPQVVEREIHQAEVHEQHRLFQRELQHLQKIETLGTLAGGIAHDFRNVLMAINGYGEMVADKLGEGHPATEDLAELMRAAKRSERLVDRILSFSHKEREKQPESLDLFVPVSQAVQMLRASLPSRIELKLQGEAGCHVCLGHPEEIEQVVINLCNNAAHAIGEGGGKITVSLAEESLEHGSPKVLIPPGRYCVLSVKDSGRGMTQSVRERIFEPFFTTKPKGIGTGLGLAMAHRIVGSMGGGIACESELGKGTNFTLYLPALAPAECADVGRVTLLAKGQGAHVLLIDDEQVLVKLTAATLQQAGYRVSQFTDPALAFSAFATDPEEYDVLVTDLAMPSISGLELARKVHEIRPRLPIVLTSGYGGAIESPLLKHCSVVLPKPCSRHELIDALRQGLSSKMRVA